MAGIRTPRLLENVEVTHIEPETFENGNKSSVMFMGVASGDGEAEGGLAFSFGVTGGCKFFLQFKDDPMEHWTVDPEALIEAIIKVRDEVK